MLSCIFQNNNMQTIVIQKMQIHSIHQIGNAYSGFDTP
jgi:hypothetical protein